MLSLFAPPPMGLATPPKSVVDILIIGAGPGGLQWASLLRKSPTISYVVLERTESASPFFSKFPRARHMISHNKCNVGKGTNARDYAEVDDDFRMRHDWHSLLNAPGGKRLCSVTKEYYPHADDVVRYYRSLASELNIEYNSSVVGIDYASRAALDKGGLHDVRTQSGRTWHAKHVVLATGLEPLPVPKAVAAEVAAGQQVWYNYGSFPDVPMESPDHIAPWCNNKDVLLVGAGNAAFEVADLLKACASSVGMVSRSPPKFAAETHYVGHVRFQKLGLLDRFLLKTLDTYAPLGSIGDESQMHDPKSSDERLKLAGLDSRIGVNIFCGGFSGRRDGLVTDMNATAKAKFPSTGPFYSMRHQENAWYAGALMHGGDYQVSAGGFIHGFRYLIRAQARFLTATAFGQPWPTASLHGAASVAAKLLSRIQTSSGLYQMQRVLADVVVRAADGTYVYIPEVPREWADLTIQRVFASRGEPPPRASCQLYFSYANGHTHFSLDSKGESRVSDSFKQCGAESLFSGHAINCPIPAFMHPVFETRAHGLPLVLGTFDSRGVAYDGNQAGVLGAASRLRDAEVRAQEHARSFAVDMDLDAMQHERSFGRRHGPEDFFVRWATADLRSSLTAMATTDCTDVLDAAAADRAHLGRRRRHLTGEEVVVVDEVASAAEANDDDEKNDLVVEQERRSSESPSDARGSMTLMPVHHLRQ